MPPRASRILDATRGHPLLPEQILAWACQLKLSIHKFHVLNIVAITCDGISFCFAGAEHAFLSLFLIILPLALMAIAAGGKHRETQWDEFNYSNLTVPDKKSRSSYRAFIVSVRRRRYSTSLIRSRTFHRISALVTFLICFQLYLLHHAYYEALIEKFSPTLFAQLSHQQEDMLASRGWELGTEDNDGQRKMLLDNRGRWKKLGSGYEGDTYAFEDAVIKVFRTGRSPLRNCLPGSAPKIAWPPEIPASLLLGGLQPSQERSDVVPDQTDFVPVMDYFFIPASAAHEVGEWYLVTPFLRSGTLEHLAERLRGSGRSLTPEEVDARFRPSFDRLLQSLDHMHSNHGLCHDDIKLDNIFVTHFTSSAADDSGIHSAQDYLEDSHWVLADLGNARQPSHQYHSSLLWTHDNGQHADCRVNDVVRLVKTYVMFLQSVVAATESVRFGEAFLDGSSPWSQLYWYIINAAAARGHLDGTMVAKHVRQISTTILAPTEAGFRTTQTFLAGSVPAQPGLEAGRRNQNETVQGLIRSRPFLFGHGVFRVSDPVRQELHQGMSVSEKWAVIFGKMGFMETPFKHC